MRMETQAAQFSEYHDLVYCTKMYVGTISSETVSPNFDTQLE